MSILRTMPKSVDSCVKLHPLGERFSLRLTDLGIVSVLQNDELTEGDVSLGAWQKRVTMLSAMWSGRINGK